MGAIDANAANEADFQRYDFFRCRTDGGGCGSIITKPQMDRGLPTGRVCPCGGLKYNPCNPRWWEFLLPRVLHFAYLRLRGLA